MPSSRNVFLGSCIGIGLLSACSPAPKPENIAPVHTGGAYQAQYRMPPKGRDALPSLVAQQMNAQKCRRGGDVAASATVVAPSILRGERLSRNDLIDVRVADDETFNGDYVISRDGTLKLPFLSPIPAQGRSPLAVEAEIAAVLVREGFYDEPPRVSVRLADFAGVSVAVSGAVFEAHAARIGGQSGDDIDTARQAALGASTEARNLSVALRTAGGVRPDADLSSVELTREGRKHILDLRGVFAGRDAMDVMLLAGDEVTVPSRACFQDEIMRPSPISPPGVSLFLSNLTKPAAGNAASAVGRSVREVPYGTRFMQAVIDTNCVGGARATSAHRSAVLLTRDPITGISTVIERNIEDMLRRADRDDYDPYLLPGDAIACYDSSITNLTEVVGILGAIAAVGTLAP